MPLASILPLLLACKEPGPWARAREITSLADALGGPKATAREGDFVLENDRVRFGILGARTSLGPHISGGALVDADLQRNDARDGSGWGYDQLAEVFPTVNLNTAIVDERGGSVEIVSDGSDGTAVVAVEGESEPFLEMLAALWVVVGQPEVLLRTEYRLPAGSPVLEMHTAVLFGGTGDFSTSVPADAATEEMPVLDAAMTEGVVLGDMYLQGGSVDVFIPDVGFDEEHFVQDLMAESINTFQDPIAVDFIAGTADGVSYAFMAREGKVFIPVFTSSMTAGFGGYRTGDVLNEKGEVVSPRFAPGTAIHYDRLFSVGAGDVGSALDGLLEANDLPRGRVEGHVIEQTTGIPLSDVHVFARREGAAGPWNEWRTDVGTDSVPDGSFGGSLPPGDWELFVHTEGRPTSDPVSLSLDEGETVSVSLVAPRTGEVQFVVVDETGQQVPAKVSFFDSEGGDPRRPDLGDGYIAGAPAEVEFAPYGEGTIVLPPGKYQAVASRGLEYELGTSEPFVVDEVGTVQLSLQVIRSVDTSGWVSADFHVHSVPSHDSGVSLETRVFSMVSEGMEYFTSTDHDAITDFAPTIESLALEPWISSGVGLEVTTIEVGHFLGFPLRVDTIADHGGALDWQGLFPREIIGGLRDLGDPAAEEEPVVFVAHPRDGILGYFDQYGFDPYVTALDGGPYAEPSLINIFNQLISAEDFTLDFDAMELFGGKALELARTPTDQELDDFAADPSSVTQFDILTRTMEEQAALESGVLGFAYGVNGQIDDWFSLLNQGFRYTALANSDTHDRFGTEAGCPRNYVQLETDDPAMIDDDMVSRAVKEGRVVLSYGPFVRFWADQEQNGPGTTMSGVAEVELHVEVQSPTWFHTDRVELYENGSLIHEWVLEDNGKVVNLSTTHTVRPEKDSWYVVLAAGDDDLGPVFTPVEYPRIQLQDIVVEALSGIEAVETYLSSPVPRPRTFPLYPLAVTNPIWLDLDGDGFDAPGIPAWVQEPVEKKGDEDKGEKK